MIRAVYDCMVYLQATGRPASHARRCFEWVEKGVVTLCVDDACLDEIREVVSRPALLRKFPDLAPSWPDAFVRKVSSFCERPKDVPQTFRLARDPKDSKYVNLAIAVCAEYLVSRDRDLLDLMRDDTPEAREFRQLCPTLTVLDPEAFLREIEARLSAEESEANGPNPDA